MSLQQFESALTMLIRRPDENRGEGFEFFLERFELSDRERRQLRRLSDEKSVKKYGYSMRNVRADYVLTALELGTKYMPEDFWVYVSINYFEPVAIHISGYDFAEAFLEFFLSNPLVKAFVEREAPPYLNDLVKMDLAQLRLDRRRRDGEKNPFEVVSLDYDIPLLFQELTVAKQSELPVPMQRKLHLLLISHPDGVGARFFEVDHGVAEYLNGEIGEAVPVSTMQVLKELGLCPQGSR